MQFVEDTDFVTPAECRQMPSQYTVTYHCMVHGVGVRCVVRTVFCSSNFHAVTLPALFHSPFRSVQHRQTSQLCSLRVVNGARLLQVQRVSLNRLWQYTILASSLRNYSFAVRRPKALQIRAYLVLLRFPITTRAILVLNELLAASTCGVLGPYAVTSDFNFRNRMLRT